ncbi:MAG TPA: ABC transporter permease [Acetobacteraceae bacterium]|jgi:branched-chain amino acid transport system substrate-binding protein|nr:ABC transporter permease [Acetobacteraceae bacterium]
MNITRRQALAATGAALISPAARAAANAAVPVRIGVINDMSGPYADIGGRGSVIAAKMAAADFGGSVLNRPVEILNADHLNKPDVGLPIIREWFGPGNVGMVMDFGNTPIALGTQPMLTQFNKIAIYTSVASAVLTGKACSPLSAHWAHDSYATTAPLVRAMVARGLDTFFFLVADYTFGDIMANDAAAGIKAAGGKLLGTSRHPMASSDFASYLLAAQTSGAKVIVLCNGGTDTTNAYKQAVEFGLAKTQTFVTPIMFLSDVHSLGVQTAQGLQFTQSWYWDQTDETRAWSKHFMEVAGRRPNDTHAAAYSAVLNYLRAMAQANTDEAQAVMRSLKSLTINDVFAKGGHVRQDGRMMFDRYLARVKSPDQSKSEWDELEILQTIPAAEGFRPLSQSECGYIKA